MAQTDKTPQAKQAAHITKIQISHSDQPERDLEIHISHATQDGKDMEIHVVDPQAPDKKTRIPIPHPQQAPTFYKLKPTRLIEVVAGIAALIALYTALPDYLTIGPTWLLPAIEGILLILFIATLFIDRLNTYKMRRIISVFILVIIAIGLVGSIASLLVEVIHGHTSAVNLLRDAGLLWISNILVFALLYWEIDGGGPKARHMAHHQAADFQFPQQADGNPQNWEPRFFDYVFLAFNTSTAFSPTDTFPLTRAAKALMIIQALISFIVIALLAARAVNILGS
jgi:hypothetical protein